MLTGEGGRGKTTLAREFIGRSLRLYDEIAWIRCQSVEADLAALAPRLGPTPPPGTPERNIAEEVVAQLGRAEARWLVVYDNAERPGELDPWRPETGGLQILVTAREGGWPATHYVEQPLDVLAPHDAADLLLAEAAPPDDAAPAEGRDAAAAEALAETLGRLPLALVMAGAWLRDTPSTPFADYGARIEDILHGRTPEDYPVPDGVAPSLAAAVGLSLDRCDAAETALLNVFAWMAPEGLGADLLAPAAALPENHEWRPDIPEPLLALARDGAAAEATVSRLARRSLLTPAAEGDGHALHRLTALVLRTRQGDDADARAAAAILAVGYPAKPNDFEEWPACARLTPHVLALHAAAGDAPPPSAAMGYLCSQAAIYLRHQADRPAARALAETGLTLTRARLGDDHRETAAGHTALGGILEDMGEPAAARPHLEAALRITRALGDAAADVLPICINNLASVLEDLAAAARSEDRTQDAADLARAAQTLYREALALDRAASAKAEAAGDAPAATEARIRETINLNNLATLNAAADSRRRRALVLAHHAVQRWPDAASPEDPRLAAFLNTLGSLQLEVRDPEAARAPLRRALDIFEEHLPEGHPHRRITADWLVSCLLALDPPQTDAARDLDARYGLDVDTCRREAEARFRAP